MEHGIEELKRQWKSAEDTARAAQQKAQEAKARFQTARFQATGFNGCAAEFTKYGKTVRFLPRAVQPWAFPDEIEGPIIRKDGSEGERWVSCKVEDARNLGPWQPGGAI